MTIWATWGAEWELNSKVSFDGINKIVYVHPEVTTLDIRADLYSAWVRWITLYDNLKFSPLLRVTGFDSIGGGAYTGDIYFLINGWKLSINTQLVKVTGVLYSDNYDTPFYTTNMIPQYPATVSALVTTVSTGGGGATASAVRQELDANSTKLAQIKALLDSMQIPTSAEITSAVWGTSINTLTDKNTIGGYITKVLLSIPKFLGLK